MEQAEPATSLSLLQAVYRNPAIALPVRIRCAMACVPFESPKLQMVAQVSEQSFAELLDRRLKRFEEMKQIEAKPTNGNGGPQVEVKPPLPRLADRRFRRM